MSAIKAWAVLLSVAVFGSLVVACGGDDENSNSASKAATSDEAPSGEAIPAIEIPALWAWGDAQNLQTLTVSADAVFRGTVVALKGQHTTLPQTSGEAASGPAPRWADFPVSQFDVRVDAVMSGGLAAGTMVTFEQMGGLQTRPDGTQVRIKLEDDAPVEVGQTYLFFGSFQEDGSMVAPPFGRVKVRPDGSLVAEAGWEQSGAAAELSRRKLEDAEREIGAASGE